MFVIAGCGSSSSGSPAAVLSETVSEPDSEPPTAPCAVSQRSQAADSITLFWEPSLDNVGVAGYRIWRDGEEVAFVSAPEYVDEGLPDNAVFEYLVVAEDAAGQRSEGAKSRLTTTSLVKRRRELSRHGITWTFAEDHLTGRYVNGDWWVVGPVAVTSITTDLHAAGFEPGLGKDGSMLNPGGGTLQGYDASLSSYDAKLNAALVRGRALGPDNILLLEPGTSIVSAASWLYTEDSGGEPGSPDIDQATGTPRPVLQAAAALTVVDEEIAPGRFRPAYSGHDKTSIYTEAQVSDHFLRQLVPPASTPPIEELEAAVEKLWLDHVNGWLGAYLHPSSQMPHYGRDIALLTGTIGTVLHLDVCELPGRPSKQILLRRFLQLGIDLAGIVNAGGGWPADGGHGVGRKLPIVMSELALGSKVVSAESLVQARFQETESTFYISESDVLATNSTEWQPDARDVEIIPYSADDLGIPEWGIRRATEPERSNFYWGSTYRTINNQAFAGAALAALLADARSVWGDDAFFDYVDRVHAFGSFGYAPGDKDYDRFTYGSVFLGDMWREYRQLGGAQWRPDDSQDVYSKGSR